MGKLGVRNAEYISLLAQIFLRRNATFGNEKGATGPFSLFRVVHEDGAIGRRPTLLESLR